MPYFFQAVSSFTGENGVPGVFFPYELSPLMVRYTETQRFVLITIVLSKRELIITQASDRKSAVKNEPCHCYLFATAPLTLFLMFDLRGKILTTWFDSYLIFDFNSVDLGLWDILRLMFVRLSEACLLLLASSIHFFTGRRSYCNINNSILTRSSALGQYGICDVPR